MFAAVAAMLFVPVAYRFSPETKLEYSVDVQFEGYIPILGGQEGKVQVDMPIRVNGLAKSGDELQASSEITGFKITFNGAPLPFSLESVKDYFPKNTITFTPSGKITKNDAPTLDVPVKLPGLDVKRFPEITYLPVEFATPEIDVGSSWSYRKPFGDSEVLYDCSIKSITNDRIHVALKIVQSYETLEDESKNPVKDRDDAIASVKTAVTGSGTVQFNRSLGVIQSFSAVADARSEVTDIESKAVTVRNLKTTINVKLRVPSEKATATPQPSTRQQGGFTEWLGRLYGSVKAKGESWLDRAKSYVVLLEVGLKSLPSVVPLPIEDWLQQLRGAWGILR